MKVGNYFIDDVHLIDVKNNFSIIEIASMFLEQGLDSFIVVENKKPIYIITQTDLIYLFFKNYQNKTLREIIEKFPKKILTINKNDDVYKAYKIMRGAGVEHLIVVNENGEVIGELHNKDIVMKFVEYALKDEMTGLNNKRFLETIIKRYNKTDAKIGAIFIDIDDFKYFNDTFGHEIGDKVIKSVAKKIKESIREIDFAFRYGGDEFLVLIFNQEKDVVLKIANRIFDKISSIDDEIFGKIGISVGVAMYPDDNKDLEEVIKLADENLYLAKEKGKGKIESSS